MYRSNRFWVFCWRISSTFTVKVEMNEVKDFMREKRQYHFWKINTFKCGYQFCRNWSKCALHNLWKYCIIEMQPQISPMCVISKPSKLFGRNTIPVWTWIERGRINYTRRMVVTGNKRHLIPFPFNWLGYSILEWRRGLSAFCWHFEYIQPNGQYIPAYVIYTLQLFLLLLRFAFLSDVK